MATLGRLVRAASESFRSVRTRILASYLILLAFSTAASVIIVRQILLVRLDNQIEEMLVQETREFRQLVGGRDPASGRPFGDDLGRIFDVFLRRNVPDDDEAIITVLDGRPYHSIGRRRFPIEGLVTREDWASLRESRQGQIETSAGDARYLAVPIRLDGRIRGHFVVMTFMRDDREEVTDAVQIAAIVSGAVLIVASLLAFFAAGRVLAPLRVLRTTARSITESDLSRRIPVESDDELGDLAHTFNSMLDRLEVAFETQRDFIRDASHELRTPITIVRGHLEVMGDDPEERRATIALVTDELDRMSRLVENLLLLARAERSDFLDLGPVALDDLAAELLAKASALAPRDWQLDRRGSATLTADRQRLTQAMMNLAANAAQHTSEGDGITIAVGVERNRALLSVKDTGPGVDPRDRKRIFQRFARGTRERRRSEGAGLGLAIVRAIAEAHGGRVELRSASGPGAEFTLVIPLHAPRAAPAAEPLEVPA